MSVVINNEQRAVYCKYCGKLCIKLVSTTKENPGRMFFACLTPRVVEPWMEWVDRIGYVHSLGRFEALELVLKEKNDQIAQLELENEHISKDLAAEKLRSRCLTNLLKGIVGAIVLVRLFQWLFDGGNKALGW
ncbi:hypothetical protein Leryth_017641 [Lithospermum erythrorhizon]|nr:hypothetical protein Leryth_017641 [Lithospermum erythrorhizon]